MIIPYRIPVNAPTQALASYEDIHPEAEVQPFGLERFWKIKGDPSSRCFIRHIEEAVGRQRAYHWHGLLPGCAKIGHNWNGMKQLATDFHPCVSNFYTI